MVSNISIANQKSTRMGLFLSIYGHIVIFEQIIFVPCSSDFLVVPERVSARLSGSKKSNEHQYVFVLINFEKCLEIANF